jgi:pilus assembly protein FimV
MHTQVMETPGFDQEEPEDLEGTAAEPRDESLELDDLTEGVEEADLGEAAADDEAAQVATAMAGSEDDEAAAGIDDTQEMPPVTMSEVGTKLDLARAYIDMGDPDGAKSILEEVLAEGDDDQQAEARELIDSLG